MNRSEYNLPSASEMERRADDTVSDAVASQMPRFTSRLIEGMMPGVKEMINQGVPESQARQMASDHVSQYVGAVDHEAVGPAISMINSEIDFALGHRKTEQSTAAAGDEKSNPQL